MVMPDFKNFRPAAAVRLAAGPPPTAAPVVYAPHPPPAAAFWHFIRLGLIWGAFYKVLRRPPHPPVCLKDLVSANLINYPPMALLAFLKVGNRFSQHMLFNQHV